MQLHYGQLELLYSCCSDVPPAKHKLCTYMVTIPSLIADEAWGVIGIKNTQCKMISYLAFKYLQSFHCIETSNWVLAL